MNDLEQIKQLIADMRQEQENHFKMVLTTVLGSVLSNSDPSRVVAFVDKQVKDTRVNR